MKLSKHTLNMLKNFSDINMSIEIKKGNVFFISCDGYDDASYDAGFSAGTGADYADGHDAGEASVDTQSYYDAGAESGDLNLDGVDNVLDVVILVNNILNP